MGDLIRKLTEQFSRFPGIGPRQARRFVYFLLTQSESTRKEIAEYILALGKETASCQSCMRFHEGKRDTLCRICADENRETHALMIVEKDVDIDQIERASAYKGRYFVLGGRIPILDEKPESRIRITALKTRVQQNGPKEIIFALSATPEGEHTEQYLRQSLATFAEKNGVRFSVLGRGLSTGAELEYADPETLRSALRNRA